jgi:hypothetical protein
VLPVDADGRTAKIRLGFSLLLAVPVALGIAVYLVVASIPAPHFDHLVGPPLTALPAAVLGALLFGCGVRAAWVFLRHGRAGLARLPNGIRVAMRLGAALVVAGGVAFAVAAGSGWRPLMSLGVMAFALPVLVPFFQLDEEIGRARRGEVAAPSPPMGRLERGWVAVSWTACFGASLAVALYLAYFPFFEWVAHRDYAKCTAMPVGTSIAQLQAQFGAPAIHEPGIAYFDPSPGYTLAFSTDIEAKFDPATGRTTDIDCGEGW